MVIWKEKRSLCLSNRPERDRERERERGEREREREVRERERGGRERDGWIDVWKGERSQGISLPVHA